VKSLFERALCCAITAVARNLAIVPQGIRVDGTMFDWSREIETTE